MRATLNALKTRITGHQASAAEQRRDELDAEIPLLTEVVAELQVRSDAVSAEVARVRADNAVVRDAWHLKLERLAASPEAAELRARLERRTAAVKEMRSRRDRLREDLKALPEGDPAAGVMTEMLEIRTELMRVAGLARRDLAQELQDFLNPQPPQAPEPENTAKADLRELRTRLRKLQDERRQLDHDLTPARIQAVTELRKVTRDLASVADRIESAAAALAHADERGERAVQELLEDYLTIEQRDVLRRYLSYQH